MYEMYDIQDTHMIFQYSDIRDAHNIVSSKEFFFIRIIV